MIAIQLICQSVLISGQPGINITSETIVAKADGNEKLEPEKNKVIIKKRTMTGTVRKFMASTAATQCTVKTKTAFISKMYQYMNARKTRFTIIFQGDYRKVYNGGNIENLFAQAWNKDSKKHSDDFDYLHWNIATYGFGLDYYSNKKSVFRFKMSYRESASQLKKVNTKVKKVLAFLGLGKKSDVEKIRAIHDYIAKTIQYDNSKKKFTAYAGLVDSSHKTVCQGYALLFYKMCTDAGIPCRVVTGWAGTPHAWNIVKLDKKWYYVDVTWDDIGKKYQPFTYDYFLVGSNTFNWDHELDKEYKTAAFKKKYPISTKDYKWSLPTATPIKTVRPTTTPVITRTPTVTPVRTKFPTTKPVKTAGASTIKPSQTPKITATLTPTATPKLLESDNSDRLVSLESTKTALKEKWDYENAKRKNQYIYDCYLETLEKIVLQLTEEKFLQWKEGTLKDDIFSSLDACWKEQLTLPAQEYLKGSKFKDDTEEIFQKSYTKAEIENMTEEEKEKNREACGNAAFIAWYQVLYQQVSQEVISSVIVKVEKE